MYNDEKFCILHEAAGAEWSIQNFKFIVHLASAFICKQNTNLTVSNTFNIKSEFAASARKCDLKNIIHEKSTTIMKKCSEQVEL